MILRPPRSSRTDTLFPVTTLFRSRAAMDGSVRRAVPHRLRSAVVFVRRALPQRHVAIVDPRIHAEQIDLEPVGGFDKDVDAIGIIAVIAADIVAGAFVLDRGSEERRVGKECVSTCRSRWSPYH